MKIEHFGGLDYAGDLGSLDAVLTSRYGTNANEFWLSLEDEKFPALAILVRDDLANVHYFPEDGHPGYLLTESQPNAKTGGSTVFFTNTPSEEVEIGNEGVVPFSSALKAAHEFFSSTTLPTLEGWFEL